MKKNFSNKIPELKSENGILSGGFSSLSTEQKRKIKGGLLGNNQCNNKRDCTHGSHTQCNNTGVCFTSE
mgnify:FL=1